MGRESVASISKMVHFSVADWLANAGDQTTSPIEQQRNNINLPLRSFVYGGTPSSTNHYPYIYGGGATVPWYLKLPSLNAANMVSGVVIGREDGARDPAETGVPAAGSPIVRPWPFKPPCAILATFALPTLAAQAMVMLGGRAFTTVRKVPQHPVLTDEQTWRSMAALTVASNPTYPDFNSLAGLVFHGGDPDGTFRMYRKGYITADGWPVPNSASTKAAPLSFGGGPARGAAPETTITDDGDAGGTGYNLARVSDTSLKISGGAASDLTASFPNGYQLRIIAGSTTVYGTVLSTSWDSGASEFTITLAEAVVTAGLSLGTTGDSIAYGGIPDKFAFRAGVLFTAGGLYALIGGHGDAGSEYQVAPFPFKQVGVDVTYPVGWEAFFAVFANDSLSGSTGAPRLYTLSGVELEDNSQLQQAIRQSRCLVL